jgi:hypothetical protein
MSEWGYVLDQLGIWDIPDGVVFHLRSNAKKIHFIVIVSKTKPLYNISSSKE